MLFIETKRLIIRNVEPKDITVMYDYRNNAACSRYQRGQNKDYGEIRDLIERRKNDRVSVKAPFMLAVALKETDLMAGEIVVIPQDGTITMGYTFHYDQHRKGFAYESLSMLINHLHEEHPDYQFICFAEADNIPSRNLLKKLGFIELGFDEAECSIKYGKWIDE